MMLFSRLKICSHWLLNVIRKIAWLGFFDFSKGFIEIEVVAEVHHHKLHQNKHEHAEAVVDLSVDKVDYLNGFFWRIPVIKRNM